MPLYSGPPTKTKEPLRYTISVFLDRLQPKNPDIFEKKLAQNVNFYYALSPQNFAHFCVEFCNLKKYFVTNEKKSNFTAKQKSKKKNWHVFFFFALQKLCVVRKKKVHYFALKMRKKNSAATGKKKVDSHRLRILGTFVFTHFTHKQTLAQKWNWQYTNNSFSIVFLLVRWLTHSKYSFFAESLFRPNPNKLERNTSFPIYWLKITNRTLSGMYHEFMLKIIVLEALTEGEINLLALCSKIKKHKQLPGLLSNCN